MAPSSSSRKSSSFTTPGRDFFRSLRRSDCSFAKYLSFPSKRDPDARCICELWDLGLELVWESGREKVEMGGLAEGRGKGREASSSSLEFHALVDGGEFGDVLEASGTEGVRLCCEEVELRECGAWGCCCAGGPRLIVLSWPVVKRPNSSTRRRLSPFSLRGLTLALFDNLGALMGRRCLLSN